MTALLRVVLTIAAGGLVLSLAQTLLPRGAIRSTAHAAIGLLFLEALVGQITGIIP